jgi:rRNA maturation protein Nop10
MTKSIFRCIECKIYSLSNGKCPTCGGKTVSPRPARFSIEKSQKYSKYRRMLIKTEQNK